jgi:hypothetical protein
MKGEFESLIFVWISVVNVFTPVNTCIEHTTDFTVTVWQAERLFEPRKLHKS